ncbi:hypothetical protein ACET3Z_013329 [Daucus carota]
MLNQNTAAMGLVDSWWEIEGGDSGLRYTDVVYSVRTVYCHSPKGAATYTGEKSAGRPFTPSPHSTRQGQCMMHYQKLSNDGLIVSGNRFRRVLDVDMKHDYAFVDFSDSRDADDARYNLNGHEVDGSHLIVEFAKGFHVVQVVLENIWAEGPLLGKFSASSNELCTTLSNANSDVSSGVLLRVVTAHVLIEEVRIAQSSKLIKNISSDEIKSEGHNNSFGYVFRFQSRSEYNKAC